MIDPPYRTVAVASTFSPRFVQVLAEAKRIRDRLATELQLIYVGNRSDETAQRFGSVFQQLNLPQESTIHYQLGDPATAILAAAEANDLLPGFELLDDEIITRDGGLHGVRVDYNYLFQTQITQATHTFDMTALTNADSSVLYMFIIRCTADCYRKRAAEFNTVATSFTVGSKV